jgi:beta-propeller repeat-containing protein
MHRGNAYITGGTSSTDFPTKHAFQEQTGGFQDAFVTKVDRDGDSLVYSSYLGGSDGDVGTGIGVDMNGNAYVTGLTFSQDFPTKDAFQPVYGGNSDAFVTKISAH